jgi:hypothetical protein
LREGVDSDICGIYSYARRYIMAKTLINFTDPQEIWLRRESKKLGVSVTEFVRRIVDARMPREASEERRAADLKGDLYEDVFRGKGMFDGCRTFGAMISSVDSYKVVLEAAVKDGLVLDGPVEDDYAIAVTDDKKVARRRSMEPQGEDS